MDRFGVQFRVNVVQRFETLRALFNEIKYDKSSGEFRDPAEWTKLVPDEIKGRFVWPTAEERERWSAVRSRTPIAVAEPSQQLGTEWNFYRVFEAIEESEYDLVTCEMVSDETAEMTIEPQSYPYGGVGPLIALAEAFGFTVLGVNECGRFESRDELLRHAKRASTQSASGLAANNRGNRSTSAPGFFSWLRRWIFGME